MARIVVSEFVSLDGVIVNTHALTNGAVELTYRRP